MADDRRVYAIICAAGKGTRMGASVPKQFLKLGSRTILETAAEVFACSPVVDEVIIVTAAEYEDTCRAMFSGEEKKISIVTGGRERQDSIFRALEFLKAEGAGRGDTVLIHDGVRPYVSANLVSEAVKIIESGEDAAVPAIAVTDTIRDTDGITLDRNRLRRVQTPQAFRFGTVLDAYEKADADGYYGTDDGGSGGGTNTSQLEDYAMTPEQTFDNVVSMIQLAKANGIKVILCSTMPASQFGWRPQLKPAEDIKALNAKFKAYADEHHIPYVDYHSAMQNEEGGLPEKYSKDGVHPTLEGYKVMEGLVQKALEDILQN